MVWGWRSDRVGARRDSFDRVFMGGCFVFLGFELGGGGFLKEGG